MKLSKENVILLGLMLFSLFFGAGNLIIPPFLGQKSGSFVFKANIGFLLSAVGFPILGVIAVTKTKGLYNLSKKVHSGFASIYTILIYLSIGPLLGIPRAASLPYEMAVGPFLPETFNEHRIALAIFTVIFFSLAYWLSITPNKLIDRLGKILTPILLLLIFIVLLGSFFRPFKGLGHPTYSYQNTPLIQGFLDGYLTMDAIAALNFGLVISLAIKEMGVKDEKSMLNYTIKAGLIASFLLIVIYSSLSYLGSLSANLYPGADNGAQTLANIMFHIFGSKGLVLLAIIFTLACLTTSVGLITSISQYFSDRFDKPYYIWVRIFTIWSLFISNLGLSSILKVSVPILDFIYPTSLVLIILCHLDKKMRLNKKVYQITILTSTITSVLNTFYDLNHDIIFLSFIEKLPFYQTGLVWVLPTFISFILSYGLICRNKDDKPAQ